jgi:hypothetical protein
MISGLQIGNPNRYRAELVEENHFYLKIAKNDGSTSIVNKDFVPVSGYNYCIVHNLEEASSLHEGPNLYVDKEFTIDT